MLSLNSLVRFWIFSLCCCSVAFDAFLCSSSVEVRLWERLSTLPSETCNEPWASRSWADMYCTLPVRSLLICLRSWLDCWANSSSLLSWTSFADAFASALLARASKSPLRCFSSLAVSFMKSNSCAVLWMDDLSWCTSTSCCCCFCSLCDCMCAICASFASMSLKCFSRRPSISTIFCSNFVWKPLMRESLSSCRPWTALSCSSLSRERALSWSRFNWNISCWSDLISVSLLCLKSSCASCDLEILDSYSAEDSSCESLRELTFCSWDALSSVIFLSFSALRILSSTCKESFSCVYFFLSSSTKESCFSLMLLSLYSCDCFNSDTRPSWSDLSLFCASFRAWISSSWCFFISSTANSWVCFSPACQDSWSDLSFSWTFFRAWTSPSCCFLWTMMSSSWFCLSWWNDSSYFCFRSAMRFSLSCLSWVIDTSLCSFNSCMTCSWWCFNSCISFSWLPLRDSILLSKSAFICSWAFFRDSTRCSCFSLISEVFCS